MGFIGACRGLGGVLVLTALVFGVEACGNLRAASSGEVGCAENDIKITEDHGGFGERTWVAECNGKHYFCSIAGGETVVHCKEDAAEQGVATQAPPATPAAVTGCQYDTQCKGDRVCVKGACVL